MTVDEVLCRWAERKYQIDEFNKVEIVGRPSGFAGSEWTPAEPDEFSIRIHKADGEWIYVDDLELIPALIREMVEFAFQQV